MEPDSDVLNELHEIKRATDKMIQHIDFVEKHINWVQRLILMFTPSLSRFFASVDKEKDLHPFNDVV